jgi:hypothetical protein
VTLPGNIADIEPEYFFQHSMSVIRQSMLLGHSPNDCKQCGKMELHHKVSGRQKQLLKTGVVVDNFAKTMLSSPHFDKFHESWNSGGTTDLLPVDWQIDLGNYCNGACVFCSPKSSSKLAQEFVKLELISKMPPPPWVNNPELVDKLINLLSRTSNLAYLHFIGGETLITPAFKKILVKLVDAGLTNVALGFTTNLITWDDDINDLLAKFKQVHLGLSIETLTLVNDYVRWPADAVQVKQTLDKWVAFAKKNNWIVSLRTTPTCLSVADLYSVYDYAWDNEIGIESCNFLWEPEHMRINVLPLSVRLAIADHLESWLHARAVESHDQIINVRDPNRVREYITQDLRSYVDYLRSSPDESHRLPNLIQYLKHLESSRHNCVLDYVPQYANLFRTAGY